MRGPVLTIRLDGLDLYLLHCVSSVFHYLFLDIIKLVKVSSPQHYEWSTLLVFLPVNRLSVLVYGNTIGKQCIT